MDSAAFFRRQAMLARRAEVMAANPTITEASALAPLMGDMQSEYWKWCLERHLIEPAAPEGAG
ncbi:hypothetical protein F4559_001118 [Saccharothrix violaceirubra]|uniref:Uncharacterized protein n=2 Tax=Saccharothrix violaceirubra TaxID=413306 RepID=A0A7W7SZC9_9PSEU|nr:hypothetical protein [Saccharothrix violaceirubra]